MPLSYDLTPFQISRAKIVKFFRWYFGPNDDTKGYFEINWPLPIALAKLWTLKPLQPQFIRFLMISLSNKVFFYYCHVTYSVFVLIILIPTILHTNNQTQMDFGPSMLHTRRRLNINFITFRSVASEDWNTWAKNSSPTSS